MFSGVCSDLSGLSNCLKRERIEDSNRFLYLITLASVHLGVLFGPKCLPLTFKFCRFSLLAFVMAGTVEVRRRLGQAGKGVAPMKVSEFVPILFHVG